MSKFVFLAALSAGLALPAQSPPQFVWEGEVDGVAVIHVRARRVDVEDKQGAPVQRQRFRFFDRLPDSRQNVELEVIEGRGGVRVIQHPRIENDYTASVMIEDRQNGAGFYSIGLRWDTGRGGFSDDPRPWDTRSGMERVAWSGRVDGEVTVRCREDRCESEALTGLPVGREKFRFTGNLPPREIRVSLDDTTGRGDTRLVEQPTARNNYTAAVRIRDHQGGSGDYSFVLSWQRPGRTETGRLFTQRGLTWRGRVDDRVLVTVQNREARSEAIGGGPVSNERAEFDQALPDRGSFTPVIRKVRGRGSVEIVEFPLNRNGYRLVFEIKDPSGGADDYQVEVSW